MTEEKDLNQEGSNAKIEEKGIFKSIADVVISIPKIFKETLDIRTGTDAKATIEDIKNDISLGIRLGY